MSKEEVEKVVNKILKARNREKLAEITRLLNEFGVANISDLGPDSANFLIRLISWEVNYDN